MAELAKFLVSSKVINAIAKCAGKDVDRPALTQIYILRYDGKIMLAALDGCCLAMRMATYDDEGVNVEAAERDKRQALEVLGDDEWAFPADLKIPNGINVTVCLHDDNMTVLRTDCPAMYGPFERMRTLDDKIFNIHNIYRYPEGQHQGMSRVMNPALVAKVVCAMSDKDTPLIFCAAGGHDDTFYIKAHDGSAYGMITVMRDQKFA